MATFGKVYSEDMVVEILSRLPPKSLMRFKCVRKSWYTTINTSSFVAKHLSNSNSKHNKFTSIVVKRTVSMDKICLSLLSLRNDDDVADAAVEVLEDLCMNQSSNPMITYHSLQSLGHCDGIICLSTDCVGEDILLCNLATKEFKPLPKSCIVAAAAADDDDHNDPIIEAVGFGYDCKAKNYKVVRIVTFLQVSARPRAEVYTLGAYSWREIKFDIHCSYLWMPSFNIYSKGFFYWYATLENDDDVIVSFDMGEEVFSHKPFPYNSQDVRRKCNLAVWNESIAIFAYTKTEETGLSMFDIWVMDDPSDQVKCTWTKRLTIQSVPSIEIPLAFWKSDELLMVASNGHVVSYNLDTKKLKDLSIHGIEAVVYVESIVPLKLRETTSFFEGSNRFHSSSSPKSRLCGVWL